MLIQIVHLLIIRCVRLLFNAHYKVN